MCKVAIAMALVSIRHACIEARLVRLVGQHVEIVDSDTGYAALGRKSWSSRTPEERRRLGNCVEGLQGAGNSLV